MGLTIFGLETLPEIRQDDDLPLLIREAAAREGIAIGASTIVVVAQKIVSKVLGAVVDLRTVAPSELARHWAGQWNRDARLVELVLRESRRIVRMERGLIIAETRHGFVAANAGVDQSNVPGEHSASVLPPDPDRSAEILRKGLGCGAVIVSDTFGRPWREGLVNVAIGVSGMAPLEDYRGQLDSEGRLLQTTILAVADELAAAAGLVMRKTARVPVALISGFITEPAEGSGRDLVRPPGRDLFR